MIAGGFFKAAEIESRAALDRHTGCAACGLYKTCASPKLPPSGRGERGVLIIGGSPCAAEDKGDRGEGTYLLNKRLAELGLSLDRDCVKTNAVQCHTPKGRDPNSNEIQQCRPRLFKEIQQMQPKLIILFGEAAVEAVIGDRWKKDLGGISRWRGWAIPDRDLQTWICPMFHPVYVTRSEKEDPVVDVIWSRDLRNAVDTLDKPLWVPHDEKDFVRIAKNEEDILKELDGLENWRPATAIDFETTGLKPQCRGHRIKTCSLTAQREDAFVFCLDNLSRPVLDRFKQFLGNPNIPKYAHHMKFEDNWSAVTLETQIRGWEWDSMLGAHLIDNRPGITSLKFQTYIRRGLVDYDSHLAHLLKSPDSEGGNGFNRIDEIPLPELMIYNGLDTLCEYDLAVWQRVLAGYPDGDLPF